MKIHTDKTFPIQFQSILVHAAHNRSGNFMNILSHDIIKVLLDFFRFMGKRVFSEVIKKVVEKLSSEYENQNLQCPYN